MIRRIVTTIVFLVLALVSSAQVQQVVLIDSLGNRHLTFKDKKGTIVASFAGESLFINFFSIVESVDSEIQYYFEVSGTQKYYAKAGDVQLDFGGIALRSVNDVDYSTLRWGYIPQHDEWEDSKHKHTIRGRFMYNQYLLFPITSEELNLFKKKNRKLSRVLITLSNNSHNKCYYLEEDALRQIALLFKNVKKATQSFIKNKRTCEDMLSSLSLQKKVDDTLPGSKELGIKLGPDGDFYKYNDGQGIRMICIPNQNNNGIVTVYDIKSKCHAEDVGYKKTLLSMSPLVFYRLRSDGFWDNSRYIKNARGYGDMEWKLYIVGSENRNEFFIKPIISTLYYNEFHGVDGHYGPSQHSYYTYSYSDFCKELFFDENGFLRADRKKEYNEFIKLIEESIKKFVFNKIQPAIDASILFD